MKNTMVVLLKLVFTLLLAAAILSTYLLFFQGKMIYHPYQYTQADLNRLDPRVKVLNFRTSEGEQFAYYMPPADTRLSELWLFFGGNGALALDWLSSLPEYSRPGRGFLLVEYPGYGSCTGSPSPETIHENGQAAFNALAAYLAKMGQTLPAFVGVFGQSLGTATALQFALDHQVEKIVLVSPFTAMREMACSVLGKPLCYLLRHNFNSEAWLREILTMQPKTKVYIFHGDRDTVVPVQMGRRLARLSDAIRYYEVQGADHIDIISRASAVILNSLNEQ